MPQISQHFKWDDPLLLQDQLNEEELALHGNGRLCCVNKYGLVIVSSKDKIIILDSLLLESRIIENDQNNQSDVIKRTIDPKGNVIDISISPSQEYLAIVTDNNNKVQVFQLDRVFCSSNVDNHIMQLSLNQPLKQLCWNVHNKLLVLTDSDLSVLDPNLNRTTSLKTDGIYDTFSPHPSIDESLIVLAKNNVCSIKSLNDNNFKTTNSFIIPDSDTDTKIFHLN
jgi:hypothetical protein